MAATGGPYALPPADATQVHALVDGDFYALRYTSGGHEFVLMRASNGPPYFRMEPQHLLGLLDGRGQRSDLAPLGTVYVTCGDGGQLANDDPQWIWSSSAVGYWLQDGRYMSLGLTTDTPLQVSFDGETGAARGPDGGPTACPAAADGEILQQQLEAIRTVDREQLDAALDAAPLTIGNQGRDIQPPG